MTKITVIALAWLLCACTQIPKEDDEVFECHLNRDGTLLICPERKQTRVASD